MDKNHISCNIGFTDKCPHHGSEIIQNLLSMKPDETAGILSIDFDAIDELCQGCDDFVSKD